MEFPPLLSSKGPQLKAYPKETVVAEKLQAIAALGRANSRMKDFYDLLVLSRLFAFEGRVLAAAIQATFDRRGTIIPTTPPDGLSREFAGDQAKQRQWAAFLLRESLLVAVPNLGETVGEIAAFALPPIEAAATGDEFDLRWADGGPWAPATD